MFSASVYIDDKRAGKVYNGGFGGPNSYEFKDTALLAKMEAFCKSLPAVKSEYGDLEMDADFYIDNLLAKKEDEKAMKRAAKTKVVFRLKGDAAGTYHTLALNGWARKTGISFIETQYGDAISAIF